jgi:chromosome partitioning protein
VAWRLTRPAVSRQASDEPVRSDPAAIAAPEPSPRAPHVGPAEVETTPSDPSAGRVSGRPDGAPSIAGHVAVEPQQVGSPTDGTTSGSRHDGDAPGRHEGFPEASSVVPENARGQARNEHASGPERSSRRGSARPGDPPAETTIVAVANQKGGVGKTTTTVSIAAALAQLGARVLLVDLDPQGNATTGLGRRAEEGEPSTYSVLVDGMPVAEALQATEIGGLSLLPSSLDLAGAEVELVPAFSRELRLRKALADVRDDFDVVLVDCPPSLGLLTVNALVAADQVLVPIQCEYYALEGLGQLLRTVQLVGDNLNRELELGGVVLTMFDARTKLSQQVVDEVRDYFGERAYSTVIPRTVRLSEAPSFGQPITVFDPHSRGARAYQRLAGEVAERLRLPVAVPEESALDRLLGGPASTSGQVTEQEEPR